MAKSFTLIEKILDPIGDIEGQYYTPLRKHEVFRMELMEYYDLRIAGRLRRLPITVEVFRSNARLVGLTEEDIFSLTASEAIAEGLTPAALSAIEFAYGRNLERLRGIRQSRRCDGLFLSLRTSLDRAVFMDESYRPFFDAARTYLDELRRHLTVELMPHEIRSNFADLSGLQAALDCAAEFEDALEDLWVSLMLQGADLE